MGLPMLAATRNVVAAPGEEIQPVVLEEAVERDGWLAGPRPSEAFELLRRRRFTRAGKR